MWQNLPIGEFWKTFTGKPFKSLFFRRRRNCHFDKARNQTEFLFKLKYGFADTAARDTGRIDDTSAYARLVSNVIWPRPMSWADREKCVEVD